MLGAMESGWEQMRGPVKRQLQGPEVALHKEGKTPGDMQDPRVLRKVAAESDE